jgi:hypothetical protein
MLTNLKAEGISLVVVCVEILEHIKGCGIRGRSISVILKISNKRQSKVVQRRNVKTFDRLKPILD